MVFRDALDIANVLIVEAYRELGMKFEEAHDDLLGRVREPLEKTPPPTHANEAASMAVLQAMIGSTDFGGPRG